MTMDLSFTRNAVDGREKPLHALKHQHVNNEKQLQKEMNALCTVIQDLNIIDKNDTFLVSSLFR